MCFIKLQFGLLCIKELKGVRCGGVLGGGGVRECVRVGSWKQSPEETNQNFSPLLSCVKATGVSGVRYTS